MKVINYNVNGIRAAIKKGFLEWLKATNADVVCLQEVKAEKKDIPLSLFEELGYHHVYWHIHEVKKGYSGVAILTKEEPLDVKFGFNWDIVPNHPFQSYRDVEGRILQVDFENISIQSVYMPSGSSGEERQLFKLEWLEFFFEYIKILSVQNKKLLITGDYNICHQPIDIHNPKANAKSSGFTPPEREWLSNFLELGFIDAFRHLNQEPHNYTWWSARGTARERNLGWRIDYQLLSKDLKENLQRSIILTEAKHSDHCPVMTEFSF